MSFQFVIHDGSRVSQDPAVRTLIRKQAMKDVGMTRKRRGNHGRVNLRQPLDCLGTGTFQPIGKASDHTSSSSGGSCFVTPVSDHAEATICRMRQSESANPRRPVRQTDNEIKFVRFTFSTEYEKVRKTFGLDIGDLSLLASFNLGKGTASMLSAQPDRLVDLLTQDFWSYLEHVPGRYGQSECVTDAVNCVLAQTHSVLVPGMRAPGDALCRSLYGKALQSLQGAIEDGTHCMDADVLCATQLLGMHELLDCDRDQAWSHHIAGTVRLIKYRSPARFQTEYEKALFACHVCAIVSECLMTEQHCYLEAPEWIELYRSVGRKSSVFDDRSSLAIDCRTAIIYLPGLWCDTSKVVNSDVLFTGEAFGDLEARCRRLQRLYLTWLDDYKTYCVRTSLRAPSEKELGHRRQLFGTTLVCLCIVKRLLAAVCDGDRMLLEAEGQVLAQQILELQNHKAPRHAWLSTRHEVGAASAMVITKEQWEEDVTDRSVEQQKLAIRVRYNMWCSTLRAG